MTAQRRICIGAFAGAHGVKGEAKVKTFTESEDGVARYGAVESEDGKRRFSLKFIRVLKPGLALVSAPEIKSREDAAALAGLRLYVDRSKLPPADEDEFYIEDLVSLGVENDAGTPMGRVAAVHNFGAGDVLELDGVPGASGKVLLPFTRAAVPVVDIAGRRIVIDRAALAEIEAGEAPDEG
ncbi:MAG: 16S rRNA processing protein RimM [Alphaproteobacteria bacterium RIFCSPHIGHO2_12_FULL_63_12]|nr:MAG: 16S rRNA processing protein RimM [Alphaproteobacteria bacterium RIFCSPHIGHO2_12_FULL_63_12]